MHEACSSVPPELLIYHLPVESVPVPYTPPPPSAGLIIGLLRVGMFISLRFRQSLEPDLKVSKPLKFGVNSGSSDDTAGNRPQFGQSPC